MQREHLMAKELGVYKLTCFFCKEEIKCCESIELARYLLEQHQEKVHFGGNEHGRDERP